MNIVAVGEILWDVFDHAEHLGGAPLNFAAAVQRLGNSATLISAVGEDDRGRRAIQAMAALALRSDFVRAGGARKTGTAVVKTDSHSNAVYRIPRPAAYDDLELNAGQMAELWGLRPAWIYFGTLAQTNPTNEALVHELATKLPAIQSFYDLNLRTGHWDLALVHRLSSLASVVKLNEEEAELLFNLSYEDEEYSLETFCRHWSEAHKIGTICVTCGGDGCAIFKDGLFQVFPGFSVNVVDTVGAGDAFAAAFLHGAILNWPAERQAAFANALGALVASRPGATPAWSNEECLQLIAAERP